MILRNYFQQKLKNIYPECEIDAIFYYYLKEKFKIEKHHYILDKRSFPLNNEIENDVARLAQNVPIQHVLGYAYFCDLKLKVNSDVLIPRPETEELVTMIIEKYKERENLRILDVGTGSGAIAIALNMNLRNSELFALDVSVEAMKIARENAMFYHLKILFIHQDILEKKIEVLPENLDIVVSNPPYIPLSQKEKLHPNVVQHDPELALWVPDEDPLLFYKNIVRMADTQLKSGGELYFETHEDFHEGIVEIIANYDFEIIQTLRDLSGKPRFITAQKNSL